MTTPTPNRARAVERFRIVLAAMGYRAYLLTDEEVWEWLQRLIASMDNHVAASSVFNGIDLDTIAAKAELFGQR